MENNRRAFLRQVALGGVVLAAGFSRTRLRPAVSSSPVIASAVVSGKSLINNRWDEMDRLMTVLEVKYEGKTGRGFDHRQIESYSSSMLALGVPIGGNKIHLSLRPLYRPELDFRVSVLEDGLLVCDYVPRQGSLGLANAAVTA